MYFDDDLFYDDACLYNFYDCESLCTVPDTVKLATCCFTGHRNMPKSDKSRVLREIISTVSFLSSKGVTNFRAGGALGFDTLAAAVVIDLKRQNPKLKLILDLPFPGQSDNWNENEKRIYEFEKAHADEINFYGETPVGRAKISEYMFKRNRALVDNSSYCICYLKNNKGGTAYTVDYATRRGLEIINLAENIQNG